MAASQAQAGDDNGGRGYNQWSSEETLTLLTLLYDGVNMGWRNKNGIIGKRTIHTKILPELKKRTGRDFTYNHYMSRWKWLKKQYAKFSVLKKFSLGFGWDEHTKLFKASDEVWEKFFKVHPGSRSLKTELIEGWDMYEVVMEKVIFTGENMAEDTDYVRPPTVTVEGETQPETEPGDSDAEFEDIQDQNVHARCSQQPVEDSEGNKESEATTGSQRKRPRGDGSMGSREVPVINEMIGIADKMDELLCTFRSIRDIMDGARILKEKELEEKAKEREEKAKERALRLADPWEVLKRTPGIDDPTRFKVLNMFKDESQRMSFIKMDPTTRKAWIDFTLSEYVLDRKTSCLSSSKTTMRTRKEITGKK